MEISEERAAATDSNEREGFEFTTLGVTDELFPKLKTQE